MKKINCKAHVLVSVWQIGISEKAKALKEAQASIFLPKIAFSQKTTEPLSILLFP